ncbi:hypothetical protein GQ42DRAFT_51148 [Ramicandelaber brevisporus]|nr:hypothetical protein GQ42DRAFT_51148 [Ramicandelaber brevisporus]
MCVCVNCCSLCLAEEQFTLCGASNIRYCKGVERECTSAQEIEIGVNLSLCDQQSGLTIHEDKRNAMAISTILILITILILLMIIKFGLRW